MEKVEELGAEFDLGEDTVEEEDAGKDGESTIMDVARCDPVTRVDGARPSRTDGVTAEGNFGDDRSTTEIGVLERVLILEDGGNRGWMAGGRPAFARDSLNLDDFGLLMGGSSVNGSVLDVEGVGSCICDDVGPVCIPSLEGGMV